MILTDKNNSKFRPSVPFLSYRISKTYVPIIKAVRKIFDRKVVTIIIPDILCDIASFLIIAFHVSSISRILLINGSRMIIFNQLVNSVDISQRYVGPRRLPFLACPDVCMNQKKTGRPQ